MFIRVRSCLRHPIYVSAPLAYISHSCHSLRVPHLPVLDPLPFCSLPLSKCLQNPRKLQQQRDPLKDASNEVSRKLLLVFRKVCTHNSLRLLFHNVFAPRRVFRGSSTNTGWATTIQSCREDTGCAEYTTIVYITPFCTDCISTSSSAEYSSPTEHSSFTLSEAYPLDVNAGYSHQAYSCGDIVLSVYYHARYISSSYTYLIQY